MELALALVIGTLYAGGFYLMLRRSVLKLVLGLALVSHGANLLVFVAAGPRRGAFPLVSERRAAATMVADPVAQALVLTAIVISFALLAFTVTLLVRLQRTTGTDDIDKVGGDP